VIYAEGYHMLTRDLQAEVVLEDIADWMSEGALASDRQDINRLQSFCMAVLED
jgi:hypothetical protein